MQGAGTQSNPYIVSTPQDVHDIRNDLNAYYELANDIDMSVWGNFSPIAPTTGARFIGYLDGKGFKILNLTINSTAEYSALFGNTRGDTQGGYIKNLGLENVYVESTQGHVAGLVGLNYKTTISNCYVTGIVKQTDTSKFYCGGMVARNYGNIDNCYTDCTVTGGSWVGGLIGGFASTDGSTSYSYSVGSVSGVSDVGGLVGKLNTVPFTSNYFNSETAGTTSGQTSGITAKTTAEMKTQSTYVGWDFTSVWAFNNDYPTLKVFTPSIPVIESRQVTSFAKAITSTTWANLVHPNIQVIQVSSYIKPITSSVYADLIQIVRKQIQVVSSVGKIDTYSTRKVKAVKEILSFMNKITGQVIVTSNIKPKQLVTLVDLLESGNDVSVIQYLLNDVYMVDVEKGISYLEDKTSTHHIETKTEVRTMALTGDTVQLQVQFKTYDGNAIEPTNVELKIYKPTSLNTFELLETISLTATEKVGVGEYHYNYTIPTELNASSINFIVYEFSGMYQNSTTLARGKVNIRFV